MNDRPLYRARPRRSTQAHDDNSTKANIVMELHPSAGLAMPHLKTPDGSYLSVGALAMQLHSTGEPKQQFEAMMMTCLAATLRAEIAGTPFQEKKILVELLAMLQEAADGNYSDRRWPIQRKVGRPQKPTLLTMAEYGIMELCRRRHKERGASTETPTIDACQEVIRPLAAALRQRHDLDLAAEMNQYQSNERARRKIPNQPLVSLASRVKRWIKDGRPEDAEHGLKARLDTFRHADQQALFVNVLDWIAASRRPKDDAVHKLGEKGAL